MTKIEIEDMDTGFIVKHEGKVYAIGSPVYMITKVKSIFGLTEGKKKKSISPSEPTPEPPEESDPSTTPKLKLDNPDDGTSGNSEGKGEGEGKDECEGKGKGEGEGEGKGEDVSTPHGETSQHEEPINTPVDLITSADPIDTPEEPGNTPEEPEEPETPDPIRLNFRGQCINKVFKEQDRISKTKLAKYIDIDIFDMGYHNQIQGKLVICYGTTKVYTTWEDMLKLPVLVNNKSLKNLNNLKQVAVKQFRKWMADHPDLLPDEADLDRDFKPHLKGVINTKPGDGGDYENTSGSYSD